MNTVVKHCASIVTVTTVLVVGCSSDSSAPSIAAGFRNPLQQPFTSTSIWNMPIGSDAHYVPANITAPQAYGVYAEEEILVMESTAPLRAITYSDAGWSGRSRCQTGGVILDWVPIPASFSTVAAIPGTPNHACAILRANGTLHQSQPFHRCASASTSQFLFTDEVVDLWSTGHYGAHGGSGLSALGGTIRLGELVPGGRIPHALKIVIDGRFLMYRRDGTDGFRWPARWSDGFAPVTYNGVNPALEMGALLALRPSDLATLETEPARIIATALRDYGAYVVDISGWDAVLFAIEWSPRGRLMDEFRQTWGFDYLSESRDTPWSRDHARIVQALHVVDNNQPNRIGGGGTPRQLLAAPLMTPPATSVSPPLSVSPASG